VTATIIPFPRPAAPDRLARALSGLTAALDTQRQAVAAWQATLAELRGVTGGLEKSLAQYDAALGGLAARVDGVNRQARTLEHWADGVLAAHGGGAR
jgi:hypothetical protein